jgi:predicted nucleotidyltransferase
MSTADFGLRTPDSGRQTNPCLHGSLVNLRGLRNNLRIVRKSPALEALFPTVRGDVLAATLTQPDKWWYLSELAQFLRTTPSSLQRELKALVAGGILQQRREGTRTYFKAETRSPLFPELRGLLEKTAGLLPSLQQALEPFQARIDCAFVYGSVARSQEHALSDVDLLVIGSVGLADLAPALRKVEARLGRDVNVTSYSGREFQNRVAAKDHFLFEVLRGPREFVQGNQRDLDEITGKPRRPTPSDVDKRTR